MSGGDRWQVAEPIRPAVRTGSDLATSDDEDQEHACSCDIGADASWWPAGRGGCRPGAGAVPRRSHRRRPDAAADRHRPLPRRGASRRRRSRPSCRPTSSAAASSARRRRRRRAWTRPAGPTWRRGASRRADSLAAGSVTRLADGRYDVRFQLWDVVKGRSLGGQSYAVAAADLRLAAHRIADFIYEKLTGEKGVFSTRIAYVTKAGQPLHPARRRCRRRERAVGADQRASRSSRRPGRPTAAQLAYVSFESRKAVVYVHDVATGERRADRQLPRLQQRAGLVARRPHAGRDALARRRLAAVHDRRHRRRAAPPDAVGRHRHRAGVFAPTAAASTSSATAAARRRSTACRRAAASPSASPLQGATTFRRRSAPTAAGWPTFRASAEPSSCR